MSNHQTVLVRYREKNGQLRFEFISGTQEEIETTLKEYLSSKDPHSLLILGTFTGEITDEGGTSFELDYVERALVTIDMAHHMVHEGDSFTSSDIDANVQVVAPKYWLVRVPDGIEFHTKISVECNTGSLLEFFENPTVTDDGAEIEFYNNKRNSSKTTDMTCFSDPTIGANGTRLQVSRVGAGTDKKIGGVGRTQFEWILKGGEEYLLRITVDANGAELTFTMDGYQVPETIN